MEVFAVTAAADLNPQLICAVADARPGRAVRIGRGLLGDVQQRCEQARAELRRGHPVYGVNTGMGALSGVLLTPAQQLEHQRNLMLARATGGPPWLDAADVRAIIAVRLRTFLSGDAGVSGQLCQRLADFLAEGIIPAVPRTGVGSAGEIMPLAHAFGPLAGIGHVLGTGRPARQAGQALRDHGLGEFTLGPKEGIALLAGVPGATAMSVRRVAAARTVTAMMEAAAGLSIVAAGAPGDPYTAACARGDDILAGVLGQAQGRHRRRPRAQDAAGPGLVPGTPAPSSPRRCGPPARSPPRSGGRSTGSPTRPRSWTGGSPARPASTG